MRTPAIGASSRSRYAWRLQARLDRSAGLPHRRRTGHFGDHSVRIWDVASGKELHRLLGHRGFVHCLAASPDGKTVASGSEDRTIHLWDVASGKNLRGGEGHVIVVGAVAWSPDGKTLASTGGAAGSYFPTILWETATGKELARIAGPGREGWMLAFTPDGKALMSLTSSRGIVFSDPATTKELHSIGVPRGYVYFALSSDGKSIVFAAGDKDVRPRVGQLLHGHVEVTRVELATQKVLGQFRGDDGTGVQAFALSGDGQTLIVETSKDQKVHVWDTGTGKERAAFACPKGSVLILSPDAKLVAWWRIGEEGTIRLSETITGEELRQLILEKQVPRYVGGERNAQPVISPDGKKLAATTGKTICVWDVATGKELKRFQGDQGVVTAMGFSADGNFLATGGGDTTVLIWNVSALSQP